MSNTSIYLILYSRTCSYVSTNFEQFSSNHQWPLITRSHLTIPKMHLTVFMNSFHYSYPPVYNLWPQSINSSRPANHPRKANPTITELQQHNNNTSHQLHETKSSSPSNYLHQQRNNHNTNYYNRSIFPQQSSNKYRKRSEF